MNFVPNYLNNGALLVVSTIIGVLSILGLYLYYRKKKKVLIIPNKWKAAGKIKNLIMYPLKSGRRIMVDRALCTEFGLQMPKCGNLHQLRDRSFVIYNEDNYSYARYSKILLIELVALDENHIALKAPGTEDLKVVLPYSNAESSVGTIKLNNDEQVSVVDCGSEASSWLSRYLLGKENGLRLGFNTNLPRKNLEEPYKRYLETYPLLRNNAAGFYSNISSYMLLTQASIDDLNSKVIDCDITVHNFRPNIVVEGAEAFAEDNWKWVKIGNFIAYTVKYCTRCSSVTINSETAERNNNYEPLRTMETYRQLKSIKNIDLDGEKCVMGINMALKQGGEIQVGDIVYVNED